MSYQSNIEKLVGVANTPYLVPALWNIGILLHKQATLSKHFEPKCIKDKTTINCVNSISYRIWPFYEH